MTLPASPPPAAAWAGRLRRAVPALLLGAGVLLSACAAALPPPPAATWPPVWTGAPNEDPPASGADAGPPAFSAPSAAHCHRLPVKREVPGGQGERNSTGGPPWERPEAASTRDSASRREALADRAAPAAAGSAERARPAALASKAAPVAPAVAPPAAQAILGLAPRAVTQPERGRPAGEVVTAGLVDDNADFGEYLAYRQRRAGLPVRDRDVSERYLLEVTDAQNRPLHDAEVAVQRAGVAEPVMWARTDTAGRVWLHPRAFLSAADAGERSLAVTVRHHGAQARGVLLRGQAQALQLRLAAPGRGSATARPRLDLVFMVDATGSMGDEIAKLKASMNAMAQQIAQLPGQPDVCFGLVAYRDRGDAFMTRTHDLTDRLDAFQQVLAEVHAGGGGDTPEALNEALHEVVHGLSWRADAVRLVVLVADAPPHLDDVGCNNPIEAEGDGPPRGQRPGLGRPGACPQYDRGMQAALAKGIKLFAVGASGLDPVGEYIFRQMAQYTAGRFVFLTYRRATDPGSGPGTQTVHDVRPYSVQTLDALVLRLVGDELARLKRG